MASQMLPDRETRNILVAISRSTGEFGRSVNQPESLEAYTKLAGRRPSDEEWLEWLEGLKEEGYVEAELL